MADALTKAFRTVREEENRAALVAFITCGYPTVADTVPTMLALQRGGTNVIELGVPFSDPVADGPTIQEAAFVALQNGVTFQGCLDLLIEARSKGLTIPVLFMGYLNVFYQFGMERVVTASKAAGANGFIVVDYPPEESVSFRTLCAANNMALVPLIAPTTSPDRIKYICSAAQGFVYCVSMTGVTGSTAKDLPAKLKSYVHSIQSQTDLPVAVGFGINHRRHFKSVSDIADGVVIGTAIIRILNRHDEHTTPAERAGEFAEIGRASCRERV
eukprot:TRINITY_DN1186_c0_g1_i2.p1 TRINITY_DN1186_c0_g1~~TRINITY_DN1186_c0_g1_i2.p1  ORF type:complete len:281 (-),score=43.57 TRINITY_DN1186_c0_g1_i2:111-926(-)